jgi:hypothetical protein
MVVQELALSSYLLARHRIALLQQEQEGRLTVEAALQQEFNLNLSNVSIISALVVAIFFGTRSDPTKQQNRKTKARQRSADFLLLAVLLRFLASVLRTLTASYSSDTVQSLALAGMTLHVLACDYTYANGVGKTTRTASSRPPFWGGTVALNAALFSTTLLVSRLSSNVSAYMFSSLAAVLFAFYSVTRHAIAATYPPSCSGTYCTAQKMRCTANTALCPCSL